MIFCVNNEFLEFVQFCLNCFIHAYSIAHFTHRRNSNKRYEPPDFQYPGIFLRISHGGTKED